MQDNANKYLKLKFMVKFIVFRTYILVWNTFYIIQPSKMMNF